MGIPATGLQAAEPAAAVDWTGLGLVLAIIGSFLLANAILFRHPRQLVLERFGKPLRSLHSIREYIFHRAQVHLGFLFLLAGFGLQAYGHYQPRTAAAPEFPVVGVGLVALVAIALEIASWYYARWLFRVYVREHLQEYPVEFETDTRLAREVGELFGVESAAEDTVQSYVARLRLLLRLPAPGRSSRAPSGAGEEVEEDS